MNYYRIPKYTEVIIRHLFSWQQAVHLNYSEEIYLEEAQVVINNSVLVIYLLYDVCYFTEFIMEKTISKLVQYL